MADLASHILVNHIAGLRLVDRVRLGFLVSGAVLPDLASRVPRILLNAMVEIGWVESSQTTFRLMMGFDFPHTPTGVVLVACAVALLLPSRLAVPPGRASRPLPVSPPWCFFSGSTTVEPLERPLHRRLSPRRTKGLRRSLPGWQIF